MIKTEKPLVQWDLNRVVDITTDETFNEVHFYNSNCPEVMAVEPFDDNTKANIPNILLQEALPIVVWLVYSDENGDRSLDCDTLVISPRKMPPGYVYEETEVITFKKLTKDVEEAVKRANDISADMEEKRDSGYFNGKNGKDGVDGKPAYEHAVDGGYIGSEESFAESMAHVAELEAYKANSIVTKASGVALAITDSAKIKPQRLKTYGKSEQIQYKGYQLCDLSTDLEKLTNDENSTATLDNNSVKITIINPTNTNYSTNTFKLKKHNLEVGKSYSARLYVDGKLVGNSDGVFRVFFRENMSADITITEDMLTSSNHGKYYLQAYAGQPKTGTFEYQIVVSESDKILDVWEPYVGGVASPSIAYPQEVESCGESGNIGCGLYGLTLFDASKLKVINAKNIDISDNGYTITLVGGNTYGYSRAEYFLDDTLTKSLIGKTIYLLLDNMTKSVTSANICMQLNYTLTDGTNKYVGIYTVGKTASFTVPENISSMRVMLYVNNSSTILETESTSVYKGVRITLAENLPWAPYTNEQSCTFQTPNGLRGIPLGSSIPDAIKNSPIHMSGIYWDSEESQYYIADTKNENGKDVQRIARKFVTEINSYDTTNKFGDVWHLGGLAENNKRMPILSNHFRFAESLKEDGIGFWYSAILRLYYDAGSKEAFNEWLAQNEVYVDYILAEPIVTDISTEEKEQLDTLIMNYPNTTIINNANAHMDVEYVADTKSYVDQKIASAIASMQALILEN